MPEALKQQLNGRTKQSKNPAAHSKQKIQKIKQAFQVSSNSRARYRGQSSVEYLFVLVFLVGFVVAVIIPAVKEAELSTALASARSAAVHFSSQNLDFFISEINYTVEDKTVTFHPRVYFTNTTNPTPLPEVPAALAQGMLDALQSSVAQKIQGNCAQGANYAYCV